MNILEKNLRDTKELEGGLFADISINYCGRDYVVCRDLYTVKDNIVYSVVNDGTLYATGDTLWNIKRDCHRIGKYNPEKKNESTNKSFSYSEIKKTLGL
jgi:hypothetical protein